MKTLISVLMLTCACAGPANFLTVQNAGADPVSDGPPLLLAGSDEAYWLLLVPAMGSNEMAESGVISAPRGYCMVPRQYTYSTHLVDGSQGQRIQFILPSPGGVGGMGGMDALVPRGVEYLGSSCINSRVRLLVSDAFVANLRAIGANDDSARIDYVDYTDWPRNQYLRSQKLANFDPLGLNAAVLSAFAWDKQARFSLSSDRIPFTQAQQELLHSGLSIRLDSVIQRLRKNDVTLAFPDPALLRDGPESKPITIAEAFDRINNRIAENLRTRPELAEMQTVLPEGYWRVNLLSEAYFAYYEAADTTITPSNSCSALRVDLRKLPLKTRYLETYYTQELGPLTIRLSGRESDQ